MTYKSELAKRYAESRPWGLLTSIDLQHCDGALIRSKEKICQYVEELCDLIEMKRYGETQVVHFGEDPRVEGYSMVQLIETSLISGHFANESDAAYIDIFSCKYYEPELARDFTQRFFGASEARHEVIFRG